MKVQIIDAYCRVNWNVVCIIWRMYSAILLRCLGRLTVNENEIKRGVFK